MENPPLKIVAVVQIPGTIPGCSVYHVFEDSGYYFIYSKGFDTLPPLIKQFIRDHSDFEHVNSQIVGGQYIIIYTGRPGVVGTPLQWYAGC